MTHVFLMHTHKDAAQVKALVNVLRRGVPNAFILISHDARAAPLDIREQSDVRVVYGPGGRGDFAILDGYLAGLRWLRAQGVDYQWITNLSGQDFPTASLRAFSEFLDRAGVDGFLHHFDAFEQNPRHMGGWAWPERHGSARYQYQYKLWKRSLSHIERGALRMPRLALEKLRSPVQINTSFGLMVGVRSRASPFTDGAKCYAGSYWHTLRSACARFLLDHSETKPDVLNYFRNVLIPDEAFIQTVLVNSRQFNFTNNNLRYADFRGRRHGHPKFLSFEDLEAIANSGAYFARKFEWPNCIPLLDVLERRALRLTNFDEVVSANRLRTSPISAPAPDRRQGRTVQES